MAHRIRLHYTFASVLVHNFGFLSLCDRRSRAHTKITRRIGTVFVDSAVSHNEIEMCDDGLGHGSRCTDWSGALFARANSVIIVARARAHHACTHWILFMVLIKHDISVPLPSLCKQHFSPIVLRRCRTKKTDGETAERFFLRRKHLIGQFGFN